MLVLRIYLIPAVLNYKINMEFVLLIFSVLDFF